MNDSTPWPGHWSPLGATYHPEATNFALWAPDAEQVEVCLFAEDDTETRHVLPNRTFDVRHGAVPGVRAGQRYGFRVHGPWDPAKGQRFNPAKLLVDPYARAVDGELVAHPAVFGHDRPSMDEGGDHAVRGNADSAPYVPKSVVVDPEPFDWRGDAAPRVPWAETVLYETHVRGFTMRHPDIPAELRGTYAGLGHPAAVEYLTDLGITTVELMPVHQFVSEPDFLHRGSLNYWGYNTLAFFAPHNAYASSGARGQQVTEFKGMVRALHEAGLEVILDVVYNHTAEQGDGGPMLSFRGIANDAYYHVDPADPSQYLDYTGTGNTFRVAHPAGLGLVMDSLRYWVGEMRVDGFRFDLASALARSMHDVDMLGSFMTVIGQDPVLREVKLIAEPWDVGPGGYQVGEFPHLWTEWNDKYRNAVRDHWRGAAPGVRDLAYRLSGSSDLYADDRRRPYASINFVTAHDGFTMRDLVSYDHKHNEANGEDNRDGTDDNRSWNHGAEGIEADGDPAIRELRLRQIRNLLATMLLSTGVPMLLSGDEMGRTQRGNNNAYCQDNEISWMDWSLPEQYPELLRLAQRLLRFRRQHPVVRQRRFFEGVPVVEGGRKDIAWFAPSGREMTDAEWHDGSLRTLGMYLNGEGIRSRGVRGERIVDESFLVWLHAGPEPLDVTLPAGIWASSYEVILDTAEALQGDHPAGTTVTLTDRSCLLLRVVG
ncbi:glycogen debranching protein GlgX [Jiangella asiatica]|uniref:glycogen debranching protein GlgX n=1 Tax=Jiangella asiatica TaxID=2530372 RepID=UPI001EEFF1F9|nr:glycogen debranching protein GlgX [Jiangella asiatica]